jgi:hypothetical protein
VKQQQCRAVPGAEHNACYGDLVRDLNGGKDSGGLPFIAACIVTNCSTVCGGPGVI